MVAEVPGVGRKPLRDCTDKELRAIARQFAERGKKLGLFTYDELLRMVFEARDEERRRTSVRPGYVALLWWDRLLCWAESRSRLIRRFMEWRDRGEPGDTQVAVSWGSGEPPDSLMR